MADHERRSLCLNVWRSAFFSSVLLRLRFGIVRCSSFKFKFPRATRELILADDFDGTFFPLLRHPVIPEHDPNVVE